MPNDGGTPTMPPAPAQRKSCAGIPQRPIRRSKIVSSKSPGIPTNSEIESQLKTFLAEIQDGGEEEVSLSSAKFVSQFLEKLKGPPWFLQLHPANLLGDLNLPSFIEFIKSRLVKGQRDSLLISRNRSISDKSIPIPLSFPQEQIWLQMQDARAPTLYNYSGNLHFPGIVDIPAMRKTLDFLIQRHEILGVQFIEVDGKPCQRFSPASSLSCNLQVFYVSSKNFNLQRMLAKNLYRPFQLDSGPMFRYYLFIVKGQFSLLQFVGHHLMADGTGFHIYEHDLRKTYAAYSKGVEPILPEIPISYSDYALWQRETMTKLDDSASAIFWRQYLNGITALEIPRDRPKIRSIGCNSARVKFEFSQNLTTAIRNFSRECNVTSFVTLLGGLNTLFYRYIPQLSISILTAKHGRTNAKIRTIFGHFVNTLIVRTAMSGNLTFQNLVQKINMCLTGIFEHEEYPFQYILRDLISNSTQEIDKVALFPVFVVMMPKLPGGQSSTTVSNYTDIDNNLLTHELTIIFDDGPDMISGYVKYNPVLHTRARILRMISHLETLLENATLMTVGIEPVSNILDDLSIIPIQELNLLSKFSRGKEVHFNKEQTVIEIFEYIVRARRNNLAVLDGAEKLTYRELNHRAASMAAWLQEICKQDDEFVAVFLPQSVSFLTTVIAILKSGRTVVPLNVHASVKQVEIMLKELGNPVLVSTRDLLVELGLSYSPVFLLDGFANSPPDVSLKRTRSRGINRPAYCIFTSGSTGTPKAVMVDNANIVNLVNWMQGEFEIVTSDRSLCFSNSAYDAALLEYWPYLLGGAAVLIPPFNFRYELRQLMEWVDENKVTILNLPTNMAHCLVTRDFPRADEFKSLRLLTCGGEKLHSCNTSHLPFKMVNSYGLTESCVVTTSGYVTDDAGMSAPTIGKPIWNSQVYALDGNLRILPIGVVGEICISGVGISRGYLNNPELSSQKFVPNPYGDGKLCKTGDLGSWLPDGSLSIVGRMDYQVKIRGHRIELGEIEEVISAHPQVQQAIVFTGTLESDNSKTLIAYCQTKFKMVPPSFEKLKDFLQDRLPYYAIPTSTYFLDKFPYNANGKVDREKLARGPTISDSSAIILKPKFEPLLTNEEEIVALIWAVVLNVPVRSIGRQSNFFALGGQSMLIAEVVNRLKQAPLFAHVKVADLFRDPSLLGFSQVVKSRLGKSVPAPKTVIPVLSRNPNIPVPLSYPQEQVWLHMQESTDATLYNEACSLTFTDNLDIAAVKKSLDFIFGRHDILRFRILEIDGKPNQIIMENPIVDLPVVDLTQVLSVDEQEKISRTMLSNNRQKKFEFEKGPLIRFTLLKFPENISRMQIVFHHLIMDAIGMNIFETELRYFYKILSGNPDISKLRSLLLPPLKYQYADFATAQNKELVTDSARQYWKGYLKGIWPVDLQTDRPRGCARNAASTISGGIGIQLSAELTKNIKEFSQCENSTVYVTLVSALVTLIHRYTKQNDIFLVSATSGRNDLKFADLIGYFVNMSFLRLCDLGGSMTFRDLIRNAHESAASVYEFQDYPFQSAVAEADLDNKSSTLFRLGVTMEPRICKSTVPGCSDNRSTFFFEQIDYGSKFELLVCFDERDANEGIQVLFVFNRGCYDQTRIELMAKHFETLLGSAISSAETPIDNLNFMSPDEKKSIVRFGISEKCSLPTGRLEEMFEREAVGNSSPKVALTSADEELTYANLNSRVNIFTRSLLAAGSQADEFVAILLPQSPDFIISTLAVFKIGKTVTALSIDYSTKQLIKMLQVLNHPVLVTTLEILQSKNMTYDPARVVHPGKIFYSEITFRKNPNPTAYCIFTSGSTGTPKPVLVRHDAILNFTNWMRSEYEITSASKSFLFCSPAFDFSFAEIWPTLLSGGTLCICPAELRHSKVELISNWISNVGVTLACFPTSIAEQFFSQNSTSLKWLICAGECLGSYPPAELSYGVSNWYGLTEATVMTTFINFQGQHNSVIPPVGKPIPNTQVYVLDGATFEPTSVGITGEVLIGGFGVSPGYYGKQTAEYNLEKFITGISGQRLCRTGDLGYWLPDGNLVIIGRADNQVKIAGYRIELGEIESVLREVPGITQAIALQSSQRGIVTFCTGTVKLRADLVDLAKFLKDRLPHYAIPNSIYLVKEFPLNAVGKIDRNALLALRFEERKDNLLRRHFEKPRTEEETIVAQIWANVLDRNVDDISRKDDFFSLGGHSLLATEIVSKFRAAPFFIEIRVVDVFRKSSLYEFAKLVMKPKSEQPQNLAPKKIENIIEKFPLSFSQQQIWLHAQELQRPLLYNEAFSLNFQDDPAVDTQAVDSSLFQIFGRHQILRATIQEIDGKPYQKIAKMNGKNPPRIRILDLSRRKESLEELESFSKKLAVQRQMKPFNLGCDSLVRIYLIKFRQNYLRIQVIFHHLILDAVSVGIFEKELRLFYDIFKNNKNVQFDMDAFVPPLPAQYSDYVLAQKNLKITSECSNFWKEYLKDLIPLELPTDFPNCRNSSEPNLGGHFSFTLSAEVSEALRVFSQIVYTTPFVVFLTAIKILMSRYTGQDDIFIVSTTSGRGQQQTEDLIGYFVNMIILRTKGFLKVTSFQEMLGHVHESTIRVYEYQATPFQTVVSNIDANFGLFRLVVTMEPRGQGRSNCSAFSEALKTQPKYELTIGIDEVDNCFNVGFLYNTSIFSESRIRNMNLHFQTLLADALEYPLKCIQNLNLLTESEKKTILETWNQTGVKYERNGNLLQQFEDQVRRTPDNTACIDELGKKTSYGVLNSDADKLAQELSRASSSTNELICVLLPQSKDFITSTIAIFKISKICVPFSIHSPPKQIQVMLDKLNHPILITSPVLAKNVGLGKYPRIFYMNKSLLDTSQVKGQIHKGNTPTTTAYCIFTSGSTGQPKLVRVEHNALVNLVNWMRTEFNITWTDKSLLFCSTAFDFSFAEIWPFLLSGATLCIPSEEVRYNSKQLMAMVQSQNITFVSLPTATAQNFFTDWNFENTKLRQLIFGGEKLGALPPAKLPFKVTHCYGLTETTVISTFLHLHNGDLKIPTAAIGRPISNVQVYVLDSAKSPVPIGISGDIYIGGIGVSPGYFKNTTQTVQKFVANPFSGGNDKLCKSGDIGFWLEDGNLCIVGRSDNQVKFRGHRIELEEIESVMTAFPGIQQAVVQIEQPNDVLTAYCVLKEPNCQGLHGYLQKQLPYYGIPTNIFAVEALSLNTVGKIDRKALIGLKSSAKTLIEMDNSKSSEIVSEEEQIISKIWGEVLQRPAESFKRTDNFFLVGGNSILIMLVISKLRNVSRIKINTSTIFSNPILSDLAKIIKTPATTVSKIPRLTRINYFKEKLVLKLPRGGGGTRQLLKHDHILLTGATGYLGSGLLAELLLKLPANSKIYCLTRARGDSEEVTARVKRSIQPFQGKIADNFAFDSRVICIAGDLSKERFGLDETEYAALARKIDTVYHCAAEVHFLKTYEDLRVQNVESTKQVIRFAANQRVKTLHYISTLGVLGYKGMGYQGNNRKILKEANLKEFNFGPNDLSDGYSQSKWVAEKLVWDAIESGLPGVIYRPGEIGPHSSKRIINKSDMFATVVKSCVELQGYPTYDGKLPFATLDFICAAIVDISLRKTVAATTGKVFHVFQHLISLKDVFENCSIKIPSLGLSEWVEKLMERVRVQTANVEGASGGADKIAPLILLSLYLSKKGGNDLEKIRAMLEKQNSNDVNFCNSNLVSVLGTNGNGSVKKAGDIFRYLELLLA